MQRGDRGEGEKGRKVGESRLKRSGGLCNWVCERMKERIEEPKNPVLSISQIVRESLLPHSPRLSLSLSRSPRVAEDIVAVPFRVLPLKLK